MRKWPPKTSLVVALLASLVAFNGWAFLQLTKAKSASTLAEMDVKACPALAAEIMSLRDRPSIAQTEQTPVVELASRLEQVAKETGMTPESLVRISPQPLSRLNDTPYIQASTQVLLKDVTLQQASEFLCSAANGAGAFRVTAVRLAIPENRTSRALDTEEELPERWTVEATLTSLIYSPKTVEPARANQGVTGEQ